MHTNKIYQGDALDILKNLPSESINCCVTSPPYWALRDYGVKGQLGLEPNFNDYINKLCDIFDEVKRVLRKDGTLWVNIGDTYGTQGRQNRDTNKDYSKYNSIKLKNTEIGSVLLKEPNMHKNLCNIPARFSIEMQNRGWILRNVIIWYKPNCMPSSVKDRFTVDFEYVYFFVKNKKYWFEQQIENEGSRNKRCVWRVTTKPYKEAHFATYPKELIEPMIKAGCPEFVCNKCGFAKEKIIDSSERIATRPGINTNNNKSGTNADPNKKLHLADISKYRQYIRYNNKGYTSCNCNEKFSGGIVLDPFFGSGTTGLVALEQNKKFIGIELNPSYIEIANKRLNPLLTQKKLLEE